MITVQIIISLHSANSWETDNGKLAGLAYMCSLLKEMVSFIMYELIALLDSNIIWSFPKLKSNYHKRSGQTNKLPTE